MGRPLSEETKRKISEAHTGRPLSPEHIQRIRDAKRGKPSHRKGKRHTQEALAKMSHTWFKKGHHLSENWYAVMKAKRGIKRGPMSDEARAKVSAARRGQPSHRKGKLASPATRERLSAARIKFYNGDPTRHPRWISDRSKLKTGRRQMYDTQYKYWMQAVKRRDGWKCRMADQNCKGRIEAHHILGWQSHPELRYQPNNGITLCRHHHPLSRKAEMELSPYFQKLVAEAA